MKPFPTRRLVAFSLLATVTFFAGLEWVLWAIGGVGSRWVPPSWGGTGAGTVICAGDSVTFGLGADTDESYPAQLGRLPVMQPFGVGVVNLGKPGQDMDGAVKDVEAFLAEAHPENPVVLLLAGFNDCVNLPGLTRGPDVAPRAGAVRGALGHFRTYRLLRSLFGRVLGEQNPGSPVPLIGTGHDVEVCRNELAEQGIELAIALARTYRFRLLVTTYPVPVDAPRSSLPEVTTTVNALLRQASRRLHVPLLDTVACIQAAERTSDQPFFNDDGVHLFARGYGAMARCVATLLAPYLEPE